MDPCCSFDGSLNVIPLLVKMYIRYPLLLRKMKDIRLELAININHQAIGFWSNHSDLISAAKLRGLRAQEA